MKKLLKKSWPFLIIVIVWFLFSYPFFVKGLVPFPSSYLVDDFSPWSAYPEFAGPVKNAAMPDIIGQIFPWKMMVIEQWKSGNIPLWNPYSFSGTPLLANYQSAALSLFNLLYFILPFVSAWSTQVLLQPLLAGLFMFLYAKSLKLKNTSSLVSSVAFMFCGFITTWMAYGTLAYAILYLPLALFAIEKYLSQRKPEYLLLLCISFPLSFFSGHFQMSIYFATFVFLYLIFKHIWFDQKKETPILVGALIIGMLFTAPQLLPSIEFYFESVRSGLFLKLESIPWGYLPTFIAPDFYGNPVTRNDWFGHYAEWNMYIGVIPIILGLYSLTKINKYTAFFMVASISVILLSFESPLLDLLVSMKIPVISTSAASRIIVLFSFSMAILAGFGLERLAKDIDKKKYKYIYLLITVFGFAFVSLFYVVAAKLLIPLDKNEIAFSNLRLPVVLFATFFILVISLRFIRLKHSLAVFAFIILVLLSFDMLRFATKWMPFDPGELVYPDLPVTKFVSSLDDGYRGLGNYGAEASVHFKMPYLEGYDPLYIQRYGEFIASVEDGNYHNPERSVVNFPKRGEHADRAINLMGVKYIIHKVSDGRQIWAFPFWEYPVDQYVKIYNDTGYEIYQNQKVHQRVSIIPEVFVAESNKEALKKIYNPGTDLKKTLILEKDVNINNGTGSAELVSYEPSRIQIKTNVDESTILFLADPFYPGWKAVVNGEKKEILRANYAFRAVEIPKGESEVEMIYSPSSFKYGLGIAAIGLVLIVPLFYLSKKLR